MITIKEKKLLQEKAVSLMDSQISNGKILFLTIRGSHAYGTNVETSDIDVSGVYIQDIDDILSDNYIPQISDEKSDMVLYEIKRFLELASSNNPNIFELLFTPEECIIFIDKYYEKLINTNRERFITKECANTFAKYATSQINKAMATDKKHNWEKERIERKTPLDFCYYIDVNKSIPLIKFLQDNNFNDTQCGLSKVTNARDLYHLFYDKTNTLKYKGICFENSNDVKLTSIPIDAVESTYIGTITYNKDAYSTHCKDYNSYQKWLSERNNDRYVDIVNSGQKIDGKNMLHCVRLLNMSSEIAEGKGIIVRRPEYKELLDIKKGRVTLLEIVENSKQKISKLYELFDKSSLPDNLPVNIVQKLLLTIRKHIYNNYDV